MNECTLACEQHGVLASGQFEDDDDPERSGICRGVADLHLRAHPDCALSFETITLEEADARRHAEAEEAAEAARRAHITNERHRIALSKRLALTPYAQQLGGPVHVRRNQSA